MWCETHNCVTALRSSCRMAVEQVSRPMWTIRLSLYSFHGYGSIREKIRPPNEPCSDPTRRAQHPSAIRPPAGPAGGNHLVQGLTNRSSGLILSAHPPAATGGESATNPRVSIGLILQNQGRKFRCQHRGSAPTPYSAPSGAQGTTSPPPVPTSCVPSGRHRVQLS